MMLVPPGIVAEWTPGFAHSWTAPLVTIVAGFLVLPFTGMVPRASHAWLS